VAEGNKVRLELTGGNEARQAVALVVSDGGKTVAVADNKARPPSNTPKDLTTRVLTGVARAGVFLPSFVLAVPSGPGGKEFDINEIFKVSDFKLGKKEKVGAGEAQAIQYTLTVVGKDKTEPYACTVWVDSKTGLPVKRVLTGKEGDQQVTLTETYTKTTVDGTLDPKTFELPK
jgi:outer membrane lipoprotein-sorting protein